MPDAKATITPRREAGFALVETLVAFIILIVGLAALIEIFGGGFRGLRDSDVDAAALNLARHQLTLAGAEARLAPGRRQGTAEGMEWRVTVEPYETPRSGLSPAPSSGLEAYWITSEVRWQPAAGARPRSVRLTTLRNAQP